MTDRTCARKACRKPPVEGSNLCERHLSEIPGIVGIVASIGTAVVAVAAMVYKGYKAIKS